MDDILHSLVEVSKKNKKKSKKGKIPENFKKSKNKKSKEKPAKDKKPIKKDKQGPPTRKDWWNGLAADEQAKYLSEHPNSKKPQNGVKDTIANLSDDQKQKVKTTVNNIMQNPSKAVDSTMGDFNPEKDLSDKDKKKLQSHMNDIDSSAKEYRKNPNKKSRSNLIGSTILAASVILAAAGALTIAVGDPSLAITSIILLKQSKTLIQQFAELAKEKSVDVLKVTTSLKENMSTSLADKEVVGDALTAQR